MNTLPEAAPRRAAETILIVDDDKESVLYIQTLMQYEGFATMVAHCGNEALEIVKRCSIDLVLLDVIMPGMNGVDVARAMKKNAGNDFLPIIMVSALSTGADKAGGLTYADDYLAKPFSPEELTARVNALLRIKQLLRELSISKARYEGLYENFPHLYVSIDSRRIITDCNRFFRQTFSVRREEIVGTSFYLLFREQDRPHVEHFLNSFSLSDLPSVGQRTFTIVREATPAPLQLSLKAVYTGEADDNLSIVIAMEDVTEQMRLQEQQKIARQQLYRSARMASIGRLASGVAHEINNPLTAILGFSSALLSRIRMNEPIEPDDLHEYLAVIYSEAVRCKDIVHNLSKFAHEGDVAMKSTNLRACVEDAEKLTRARAVKAGITITVDVDAGATVIGDANKLEEVFINLITNCIDFCPPGSAATISTVPSGNADRYCRIHVADNGPGISADILPKVFDPFFTTKEVGEGTGMGLAICYKIIEECNGHIDILSEPGEGATVVLDVPVL